MGRRASPQLRMQEAPDIAELVSCGADITALRLLARTDRSALAASLKELGYSKMGHRMVLEKALLLEPAIGAPGKPYIEAPGKPHTGAPDKPPAGVPGKPPTEAPGKPPAEAQGKPTEVSAEPPTEALGKATAVRGAQLLATEAKAASSAGEASAAERLWGQVALLEAYDTERPFVEARAAVKATDAVVVAAPLGAVAPPEAAESQTPTAGALPAAESAQAGRLRAEGSEAYREGRHGLAETLYSRALGLTPGAVDHPACSTLPH